MAIFVFSTEKPMEIAGYMDERMRNVVLVGGLPTTALTTGAIESIILTGSTSGVYE